MQTKTTVIESCTDLIGVDVRNIITHKARFECGEIIIDADLPFGNVIATYTNGLVIAWDSDVDIIRLGAPNLKIKVDKTSEGFMNIMIDIPDNHLMYIYREDPNTDDICVSKGKDQMRCGTYVAITLGDYNLTFEYRHGLETITLQSNLYTFFKMSHRMALRLRVDDLLVFNCSSKEFESNEF